MTKERKMISYKLENLPDKEREIVNEWASVQNNIQQSITNVILHIVSNVGNVDVMDFDVQRELHSLFDKDQIDKKKDFVDVKTNITEAPPKTAEVKPVESSDPYEKLSPDDFE